MARKIFVSYKYKDTKVKDLGMENLVWRNGAFSGSPRLTRARDYVDKIQEKIGKEHINLGEKDGESLADFSDTNIESSLKKKIAQSSVTIVLISKGMKTNEDENNQWIPWEISYSLRTIPTGGNTKLMNAVLGIILPDETGTYNWYYSSNQACNSITHYTGQLFKILRDNMFNILEKEYRECNGTKIHNTSEPSFIKTVKWDDFMFLNSYNIYIETAVEIRDDKKAYNVHINID